MQRKALIIAMVFGFTTMLVTASAWATCVQEDLKGTWSTKVCRGVLRGEQCWDECTLTIGRDGTIKGKKGTYTNCWGFSSGIIGGQLTISDGCQIEGTITTNIRTFHIDRGGIVGDELVLGITSAPRFERLRLLRDALRSADTTEE